MMDHANAHSNVRRADGVRRRCLTLVLCAAVALVCRGGADAASSEVDADAYAHGQAYQRLFQDHVVPAICGIALERPRCIADLQAVQASRGGPDPTDAGMQAWLATGDRAAAPKDWNGLYVTDQNWAAKPEWSWWYFAGEVSNAVSLPEARATSLYLLHLPDVFVAIPPYPGISDAARADVRALLQIPNLYRGGTWSEINAAASQATLTIASDP